MLRKSAIPKHGFDDRFKILNDYLFDVETIINGGPFGYIDKVVSRYRRHKKNIGKDLNFKKIIFEENLMVLSVLEARYPDIYSLLRKRKEYYILVEAIKLFSLDKQQSTDLCLLAIKNGFYFKGILALIGRRFISQFLVDENKRNVLSKIRQFFY